MNNLYQAIPGTIVSTGSQVSPAGEQGPAGADGKANGGGSVSIDLSIGSIILWSTNIAPTDWLNCDGSEVLIADYPELYDVIGTTYGSGDGSTTYNLPDFRSRVAIGIGQGTGLTDRVLASVGGEETHVLLAGELGHHAHGIPAGQFNHDHTIADPGHAHVLGVDLLAQAGPHHYTPQPYPSTSGYITNVTGTDIGIYANILPAGVTDEIGSDAAHENMPPFLTINYIVKARKSSTNNGGTGGGATPQEIGTIKYWPVANPPQCWANCDGSELSRTAHSDLYALIGDTYGEGDGSTTFNLPNLSGRVGLGMGQGSGLTERLLGAIGGEESHVLTIAELASHTHIQDAHSHGIGWNVTGTLGSNTGAADSTNTQVYASQSTVAVNQNTGDDAPHNTMPPFLVINFIIKVTLEVPLSGPVAPIADTITDGLMRKVSGLATDYVGGDNACHPMSNLLPTGSVIGFAGSAAPNGWMLAQGQEVSRTDELTANLFAVIGTTYGVGDDSTTFNLPNLCGRVSIGAGQSGDLTDRLLGAIGGEENHVLSVAELASHSHNRAVSAIGAAGDNAYVPVAQGSGTGGYTTDAVGSGSGHNTMPPFIVLNKIIKL